MYSAGSQNNINSQKVKVRSMTSHEGTRVVGGGRVGRNKVLLIRNLGVNRGGWSSQSTGHLAYGNDLVLITHEVGYSARPVWTGGTPCPPVFDNRTVQAVAHPLYRLGFYVF